MSVPDSSVALFVSPHLDDVAFSCSGTLARWSHWGVRVVVATVFTRSVPNPTSFALACQLDKGLSQDVDYMALRRAEDEEFGRELGVARLNWLNLPEAPHRGYDSAPALFAGVRPEDRVAEEIGAKLDALVAELNPAWIFGPQAVGNHADHHQVVRALLGRPAWRARIAWYRDLPYAARFPDAPPAPELPGDLIEVAGQLGPSDLAAKFAGSARYTSQIPFQFGDGDGIARVLGDFARLEGTRLGHPGPAEAFRVDPAAVPAWNAWVRGSG